MGTGSRTGRGLGLCGGYGVPGYANPVCTGGVRFGARGFGMSRPGRGRRNWCSAPDGWGWSRGYPLPSRQALTRDQGIEMLTAQAGELERALREVKKHLEALNENPKRESE
ncbi:MAG: DUF5320 domain-containing protein [Clostridia bacterium]|nr:DUF5320 domain-containing protein [Clostridia bacterium]